MKQEDRAVGSVSVATPITSFAIYREKQRHDSICPNLLVNGYMWNLMYFVIYEINFKS